MSRSPLAYPLNRGVDSDIGGAADLQTDVMRFMAILALCLVAIFALVQSIPLAPVEPEPEPVGGGLPATPDPQPVGGGLPATAEPEPVGGGLPATPEPEPVGGGLPATPEPVVLTRPKWVPKYQPAVEEPETVGGPSGPKELPVAAEAAPVEPEK